LPKAWRRKRNQEHRRSLRRFNSAAGEFVHGQEEEEQDPEAYRRDQDTEIIAQIERTAPWLLATPHGREAAAAALSAVAAALVGTPAGRRMAADAGGAAVGAGSALAAGLETVGQAAGAALRQAAQSILPSAVIDDGTSPGADTPPVQAKADPSKKQRPAPILDPPSKH
jgi:hypothetical protein